MPADTMAIARGFDTIYRRFAQAPTLHRIFQGVDQGDYPRGCETFSFVAQCELDALLDGLCQSGGILLDLGCAYGALGLGAASQLQTRLVGVDLSQVAIAQAMRKAGPEAPSTCATVRKQSTIGAEKNHLCPVNS